MDRALVLLFLAASGISVFAAKPQDVMVTAQVFVAGKLVYSPRVITKVGQPASITEKQTGQDNQVRMGVVAHPVTAKAMKDSYLIDLDLDVMKDGHSYRAMPQVLAKAGSEAVISLGPDADRDQVQVKLVAEPAKK